MWRGYAGHIGFPSVALEIKLQMEHSKHVTYIVPSASTSLVILHTTFLIKTSVSPYERHAIFTTSSSKSTLFVVVRWTHVDVKSLLGKFINHFLKRSDIPPRIFANLFSELVSPESHKSVLKQKRRHLYSFCIIYV